MKYYLIILLTLVLSVSIQGQADTIYLKKPSFEQEPFRGADQGSGIRGWFDCGVINFPQETPPDIHPVNFWGNTKAAQHGGTYLGMVTRDNDTYESVSQKLSSKLIAGECYEFSVYLSQSKNYLSNTRTTGQLDNYTEPAVLRIWGGFGYCDTRELLGESAPVKHSPWKRYDFKFTPSVDVSSFTIEAFYKVPVLFPYNGHVLVDNMSAIIKVNCEDEPLLAEVEEKAEKIIPPHKRIKKNPVPKVEVQEEVEVAQTVKNQEKILVDLDRSTIHEGQTIEIQKLYFTADSSTISEESYEVLDEVYRFLLKHDDVKIEIGGHTNGNASHYFADILSKERAKAVAQYLVQKGIPASRLNFRGYGKRKPVANNMTKEGRAKNQRVEIKILKLG